MEKDIALSREELIEMLKKAEEEKTLLKSRVSSLESRSADDTAHIRLLEKANVDLKKKEQKKQEKIREQKSEIERQKETIEQLKAEAYTKRTLLEALEKELISSKIMTREAIDMIYASKSETLESLRKKGIMERMARQDDRPSDSPDTEKAKKATGKRGRREGVQNFAGVAAEETETVDHRPESAPKCPDCGLEMDEGEPNVFRKLVWVGGHFRLISHISRTFTCPHCGKTQDTSGEIRDAYGLMGCTPSLGSLLAYLTYAGYVPNSRLSKVMGCLGTALSKELIGKYNRKTAENLEPLVRRLTAELRKSRVVAADETPYNCLSAENRQNYFWAATTGRDEERQITVYFYENDRKYDHVFEILGRNFMGTVVCDQYGAYHRLDNVEFCYSHLERPLIRVLEAYKEHGMENSEDYRTAEELVTCLKEAFREEGRLRGLPPEKKAEERKKKVLPHVTRYFDLARKRVTEDDTPLNGAIRYGLDEMSHYFLIFDDGRVPMTSNIAEQTCRQIKMLKNNMMFSVSEKGAKAAATILSVIQTSVLNGLNPMKYIEYLMENYGKIKDENTLDAYLPWSGSLPDSVRLTKAEEKEIGEGMKEIEKKNRAE